MSDEDRKRLNQVMSEVGEATEGLRELFLRREARRKAARFDPATGKLRRRVSRNRLIRDESHIREPIGRDGAELWICYTPTREEALRICEHEELRGISLFDPEALNGYVAFPKRHAPALPITTGGIAKFIPVHGGITYAVKDSFAAVWGFDTMHASSENVPRTDPEWIRYQCAVLHHGLQVAADLWPKFRREQNPSKLATMAQALFDIDEAASGGFRDRLGFEALLSLLTGELK